VNQHNRKLQILENINMACHFSTMIDQRNTAALSDQDQTSAPVWLRNPPSAPQRWLLWGQSSSVCTGRWSSWGPDPWHKTPKTSPWSWSLPSFHILPPATQSQWQQHSHNDNNTATTTYKHWRQLSVNSNNHDNNYILVNQRRNQGRDSWLVSDGFIVVTAPVTTIMIAS